VFTNHLTLMGVRIFYYSRSYVFREWEPSSLKRMLGARIFKYFSYFFRQQLLIRTANRFADTKVRESRNYIFLYHEVYTRSKSCIIIILRKTCLFIDIASMRCKQTRETGLRVPILVCSLYRPLCGGKQTAIWAYSVIYPFRAKNAH